MKKTLLLALACSLFAAGANAQTEEKYYGGKQGSFAISFKAEPILNFAGNVLNGTLNNALDTEDFAKAISAKYFFSDKTALTAQIELDNSTETGFDYSDVEEPTEITGKASTATKNVEIRVGIQNYFRPGKRLQPFVGASILCGTENAIVKAESFEFENKDLDYKQYESTLKTSAPMNTFGVAAALGAELFLSKNISISTSLDLGVKVGTGKVVSEFDTDDRDVTNEEIDALNFNTKVGKNVSIATGQMKGNLSLSFYF
jgi:hypothetical protein